MKLSAHNARVDSSGRHNDRNFDLSLAPHIDKEKSIENQYWTYSGEKNVSLAEIELNFYAKHFDSYIKKQNERNKQAGHVERNRTIKNYYSSKQTRPEDKIIQIGDKDNHPDAADLWAACLEYQRRFDEIYGSNCKILDMALHVDEATPHVHIRRVWIYEDELGQERVSQTKALEKLGILEKDTTKQIGRYNNTKMTFTAADRQLFRDICIERDIGIEVDQKADRQHLSIPEYKEVMQEKDELELQIRTYRKELEELKEESEEIQTVCDQIDSFLTAPIFYNIHDQEVAEAKKKSVAKRAAALIRIFKEEADKITASQSGFHARMEEALAESKQNVMSKEIRRLNHKVELLSQFIVDKGLGEEFAQSLQNQKERTTNSPHRTLLQ